MEEMRRTTDVPRGDGDVESPVDARQIGGEGDPGARVGLGCAEDGEDDERREGDEAEHNGEPAHHLHAENVELRVSMLEMGGRV